MKTLIYENAVCGRCAGSGRYGPTSIYAGKCFHCLGQGCKLTTRGAKAQEFARMVNSILARDLKPGDVYRETGVTNGADVFTYWATVESVTPCGNTGVRVISKSKYTPGGLTAEMSADTVVRLARSTPEEVAESKVLGLAFQSLLTKMGTMPKTSFDLVLS